MHTQIVERNGEKYLAFPPEVQIRLSSRTVGDIIAECLATGSGSVLVTEEHLEDEFFKLETLEAGEILQKFRTYGIRLAIVVSPKRLRAGRFKEMAAEEKRGRWFSAFADKRKAEEWLISA